MDTDIVQAVARYVEDILGEEGFRYISAVVANCKMLALELEGQEEESPAIHMEALIIAAYLHDLSAAQPGLKGSPQKSAEMAVEFLRELDASEECIKKVKQAIVSYTSASATEKRDSTPIEALILYDADKKKKENN